jgi:hypothetical protein
MMRLAYTIVDTLMWLAHMAAILAALWLLGGHFSPAATGVLLALVAAADFAITWPLRWLANNLQSRTVI